MKYSILDFFVVSTEKNSEEHCFICRRAFFTPNYIEFFSNKRIKISDIIKATPLYNFYFDLQVNYPTIENIYLSKNDILEKYMEINEAHRKIPNKNNPHGDKNYIMSDTYLANDLVVAEIGTVEESNCCNIITRKVEQKYICEIVNFDGKPKFREIFTGLIIDTKDGMSDSGSNLPIIISHEPLIKVIPGTLGRKIPKLSLIWLMNDINFPKGEIEAKSKEKVKELTTNEI